MYFFFLCFFPDCDLSPFLLAEKQETYSTAAVHNASLLCIVQNHLLISSGYTNVLLVPEERKKTKQNPSIIHVMFQHPEKCQKTSLMSKFSHE